MRKCVVLFVLMMAMVSFADAQNLTPQAKRMPYLNDLFNGMPNARPPSQVIGNVYLGIHWDPTTVLLYEGNKEIEGYFARYNLYSNELEFQTNFGRKALSGSFAKSFSTKDSVTGIMRSFVNGKDYLLNNAPMTGFLEVIFNGEPCMLMKRHYLEVKDPDYKPALNSGSRDTRIFQRYDLLYANGITIYKVGKRKKLIASFGAKAAEMEAFIKDGSLSTTDVPDLVKIFDHYNSLLQKR